MLSLLLDIEKWWGLVYSAFMYIKFYECSTIWISCVVHMDFSLILSQCYFMVIKCFHFSCRAICPDFFVGQEAWKLSNDWASFNDWLKTRQAGNIDKYNNYSLSSKWMSFFHTNFCLSKDAGLDPKLLLGRIQLDVHKQKFHAALGSRSCSMWGVLSGEGLWSLCRE